MTVSNPRQLRALAILSSGIDAIKRVGHDRYKVRSQSKDGYYDVFFKKARGWQCSCPNFKQYRNDCKHIYACQFSAQLRLEVEREVDTSKTLKPVEVVECPSCKGFDVVRNGSRKCKKGTVQRYLCRACGHRFVTDRALSRLKASPEVVSVCMDLYFKGNSLAKIKHHLKMFYKTDVSRATIMRWVHKFSDVLNAYSERHRPKVGDLWNSDEMTVNIRKDGVEKNTEWIWNLMDADTRFLLASTITKRRYVKDARKPIRQGKKRSGTMPRAIITDGLQSYPDAIKKELFVNADQHTIHFRTPAKRKFFLNQNVERLNGTVRERLKVMRGLDGRKTGQSILNGERFYYNHVRPHSGLGGLTPAQAAGLPAVDLENNPWLVYLRASVRLMND